MIVGGFPVADAFLGESLPFELVDEGVNLQATRLERLIQEEPFLQLYELDVDGTNFIRVVDFANDQAATPGTINFRSFDYSSIKIQRASIGTSGESRLADLTVSISDPTGVLIQQTKLAGGLSDRDCRLDFIHLDDISDPTQSFTRFFRVKSVLFSESPRAITFVLGHPDITDVKSPRKRFNRARCHSDFQRRHVFNLKNYCNHPSDEFELHTIQKDFTQFGWASNDEFLFAQTRVGILPQDDSAIASGITTSTDRVATMVNAIDRAEWNGADRTGPFSYKEIPGGAGQELAVDFQAKVTVPTYTAATEAVDPMAGILIQKTEDERDWIFLAIRRITAGGSEIVRRRTINDVSSTNTFTRTTENALRIRLTLPDSVDVFARTEDLTKRTSDDDSPAWTLLETVGFDPTTTVRVGIFLATDSTLSNRSMIGHYYHFRFLRGSFQLCDYSLTNCDERKQLHQFNGFLGLPDQIARTL